MRLQVVISCHICYLVLYFQTNSISGKVQVLVRRTADGETCQVIFFNTGVIAPAKSDLLLEVRTCLYR